MMKKLIFIALAAAFSLNSCDIEENSNFDDYDGPTALSFKTTSFNESVPDDDLNLTIPVEVSTLSDQDRTFNVSVVDASNTDEFSVGNVTIPAGQYSGSLDVNFDFSEITGGEGDVKTLVLTLEAPNGGVTYNDTVTINYFKVVRCNDPVLTFAVDTYGEESGFQILDSDGNIVFDIPVGSFGRPAAGTTFQIPVPTLPDGTYTAVLIDGYGDGQDAAGGYSLDCSVNNLATGGGSNFGFEQRITFVVNP